MAQISVFLPDVLHAALKAAVQKKGTTVAEVVRTAAEAVVRDAEAPDSETTDNKDKSE